MDGREGKLKPSLQRNLNRWIISVTAVFALLTSLVSGWVAFNEARELQDNLLKQVASLVIAPHNQVKLQKEENDPEDNLVQQYLGDTGAKALPIPVFVDNGLHSMELRGEKWRVLVYTDPLKKNGVTKRYAVSQRTVVRDEIAWDSSLRTFIPIALLAPFLMMVAGYAVSHGLKPLRILSNTVDGCDERHMTAIPDQNVVQEVSPFIGAINRLLSRQREIIVQQQRFVADAAHELRTPLTALSLLAENMANAKTYEEAQQRLIPLQESLIRMQSLVKQLLDLARVQGEIETTGQTVELQAIVQDVIAELYPLAKAKEIDLGMIRNEKISVMDFSGKLRMLIHNAVENAIRYTPVGGQVDVSLFSEDGEIFFQVEDSGRGIPENELQKIFEPFYRVNTHNEPGSGLGLAISQEIAQRIGGVIEVRNRPEKGLMFCLRLKKTETKIQANDDKVTGQTASREIVKK